MRNVREQVSMAAFTTLGVGGPARYLAEVGSEDEVAGALELARLHGLPAFVLGGGSNLLVSDEGFPGMVVRMGLRGVESLPEGGGAVLRAGAGEDWDGFVARCVGRHLAGAECMSGIPGTVGGTPIQNVGAYGQETAQILESVRAFDRESGRAVELSRAECAFSYRTSIFNTVARERYVVLRVTFRLHPAGAPALLYRDVQEYFRGRPEPPTLAEVREGVRAIRRRKAMLLVPGDPDCRSAGSFFKNPVVSEEQFARLGERTGQDPPRLPAAAGQIKTSAAWLIERAGFARGYARGRAAISSRHTLALVNRGGASAAEIVALAREIQETVEARFGLRLGPEPVMLGFSAPPLGGPQPQPEPDPQPEEESHHDPRP